LRKALKHLANRARLDRPNVSKFGRNTRCTGETLSRPRPKPDLFPIPNEAGGQGDSGEMTETSRAAREACGDLTLHAVSISPLQEPGMHRRDAARVSARRGRQ